MSQLLSVEYLPFAPLDPLSTLLYLALLCESLTSIDSINGYLCLLASTWLQLMGNQMDEKVECCQDMIPLTPSFQICLKLVVFLKW